MCVRVCVWCVVYDVHHTLYLYIDFFSRLVYVQSLLSRSLSRDSVLCVSEICDVTCLHSRHAFHSDSPGRHWCTHAATDSSDERDRSRLPHGVVPASSVLVLRLYVYPWGGRGSSVDVVGDSKFQNKAHKCPTCLHNTSP